MARILAALLLLADAGRTVRSTPPSPVETFKSRLLPSTNTREVWGIDPAEIEWASADPDGIPATPVRLAAGD